MNNHREFRVKIWPHVRLGFTPALLLVAIYFAHKRTVFLFRLFVCHYASLEELRKELLQRGQEREVSEVEREILSQGGR